MQSLFVGYVNVRMPMLTFIFLSALTVLRAFGEQPYVGRYDAYTGFEYLNSSRIDLVERGFESQVGIRLKDWVSAGIDYGFATGGTVLTPALVNSTAQRQLAELLAQLASLGLVPHGYALALPLDSQTQTFSAGTQFAYRHFKLVTLFVRPDLGAIWELATPHARDPVASGIVSQLVPSGTKHDWVAFYGFGGGFEFNLSKHCSLRFQADFVHDHLFDDLLNGRNTVRFFVGPGFQWGKNVAE
jgi:hypothetical protein